MLFLWTFDSFLKYMVKGTISWPVVLKKHKTGIFFFKSKLIELKFVVETMQI